jgi:hypothetical protein
VGYTSAQFWANALKTFTAKVTNNIIYAADLNEATDEIEALEQVLGTGTRSKTAVAWDNVSTSWSTLTARLNNMDAGIRATDVTIHSQYALVSGSLIQPADTTSVALTVHGNTGNTHDLVQIIATDGSTVGVFGQSTVTVNKPLTVNSSVSATNGVSATGGIIGTADIATRIPVVAKGAASQSVNLFEAQNSSGVALASISASGVVSAVNAFLTNTTAGNVVSTVQAASGQTAHIQDWTTSGAAILAYIDASGNFSTTGSATHNGGLSVLTATALTSDTASRVPLTVKGASGQWANLTEYKDNSNNTLAYVTSAGRGYFQGMYPNAATQIAGGQTVGTTNSSGDYNLIAAIIIATGWSQVDRLQVWNGDGNSRANITLAYMGSFPNNSGNVRCWIASAGTAMTNTNFRFEWIAWGH